MATATKTSAAVERVTVYGSQPLVSVRPREPFTAPPASQISCCPEWHTLRLFGGGRRRISFETCDDCLGGTAVSVVCRTCGCSLPVGPPSLAGRDQS